jgi:hypothetical protein
MLEYILGIFIIIIIIVIINHCLNVKESFDTFSPYAGNHMYPFVFEQAKSKDRENLMRTLKPWEQPFNCLANAGYYNMEPSPCGIPPLVPLCSYKSMKL